MRVLSLIRRMMPARRSFVADPDQGALFSPRVIEGARPGWVYREEPSGDIDSGWRFFEGTETVEWLNEPGNCVLQHLSHVIAQWPELRTVVVDDRIRSAWEWDQTSGRYVEVRDWDFDTD